MPDTPNTCTCYCHQGGELYHGDRPCCGRPYELFAEQAPAPTTEQSSAVARSGAVPAEWRSVVADLAQFVRNPAHGHDDGMLELAVLERADALLAAPEPPQGASLFSDSKVGSVDDAVIIALRRTPNGQAGESTDYAQGWRDACNYIATRRSEPADTPRSGDAPVAIHQWSASQLTEPVWRDAPESVIEKMRNSSANSVFIFRTLYTAPPADAPPGEVAAWHTDDGRVISAKQKSDAQRGGGASTSSVASYTRPSYFGAQAGAIAVAWTYTDATGRTHYTANKTRSDATPLYPHPSAFRGAPADARDGERCERCKFIAERVTEMAVETDESGSVYTLSFTNPGALPDGAWVSCEESLLKCVDLALAGRMGVDGQNELRRPADSAMGAGGGK